MTTKTIYWRKCCTDNKFKSYIVHYLQTWACRIIIFVKLWGLLITQLVKPLAMHDTWFWFQVRKICGRRDGLPFSILGLPWSMRMWINYVYFWRIRITILELYTTIINYFTRFSCKIKNSHIYHIICIPYFCIPYNMYLAYSIWIRDTFYFAYIQSWWGLSCSFP